MTDGHGDRTVGAPIGLTAEERDMLTEAIQQLPELLVDARAMRGTRPANEGPQAPSTPGSKPPCDLTIIACQQNIMRAGQSLREHAAEACHDLPPWAAAAPDRLNLPLLALPDTLDWYAPCWWARNEVFIPLRQARTELRRLTRQQATARLLCPNCTGTLRPMDDGTWHRCTMCETVIDHRTEVAKVKPLTEHATNPALPAQATLYRMAKRGAITPIGHDDRGDLYHITHILDALSNTA